jgi:hypothetical protein
MIIINVNFFILWKESPCRFIKMRKIQNVGAVFVLVIALLVTNSVLVFAGHNNANGNNGQSAENGTGQVNHLDGCRPDVQSGNVWIFIPSPLPPGWSNVWEGGPCCAAYSTGAVGYENGDPVYLPNQCCNPPDEGDAGVPGNHCVCFMNRGWPIPNALP